jgi:phage tail-like protein
MMVEDPIPSYRFVVTLQPGDAYLPASQAALLPQISSDFLEAKGLGADLEITAYPEGGVNDHLHQLPVRHSWTRISLRRGVVRDGGLWSWYVAGLTQSLGARRDGAVIMLTPAGNPAMSWTFHAGLAAKWVGPELNGTNSAVAVETLEIAHEGLIQVLLSAPGSP